jgi:hypothetical protein
MHAFNIPLISNDKINPIFVKANTFLLTQHIDCFECSDNVANEDKLKKLWKDTFNADLVKVNSDTWTDIVFETNSDKTLFLLKHGI